MTVVRPLASFVSGVTAGFLENWVDWQKDSSQAASDEQVDTEKKIEQKQPFLQKFFSGMKFGFVEVWGDIVVWFVIGLFIAGTITVLIPDEFFRQWLDGGIVSMFIMLFAGIPLYICATASTPVAAALILKGVSPGAVLVFLLVGPATNITSLTVLFGLLGRKSTYRYLMVLSLVAVLFGLGVDRIYDFLQIEPTAIIGDATNVIPGWLKLSGAILMICLSIEPLYKAMKKKFAPKRDIRIQTTIKPL